jgi:hypothetical protein
MRGNYTKGNASLSLLIRLFVTREKTCSVVILSTCKRNIVK